MSEVITRRARAWALTRRDGVVLGFTDHDLDLRFERITFRAETGMTARAMTQTTGLSVDNTEAVGALSSLGLTEADILAGRFDAAELRIWEVDWSDLETRHLVFRGTLGEITRTGGAFRVELRGSSEPLSRSGGRVFGGLCPAVLGDSRCRFTLTAPLFSRDLQIAGVEENGAALILPLLPDVPVNWFAHGRILFLDGAAQGLVGLVRHDTSVPDGRRIELWIGPGAKPAKGDAIRIEAGCDRRFETCREKFGNEINFRGFPHIPNEDWLTRMPHEGNVNIGGRRG